MDWNKVAISGNFEVAKKEISEISWFQFCSDFLLLFLQSKQFVSTQTHAHIQTHARTLYTQNTHRWMWLWMSSSLIAYAAAPLWRPLAVKSSPPS